MNCHSNSQQVLALALSYNKSICNISYVRTPLHLGGYRPSQTNHFHEKFLDHSKKCFAGTPKFHKSEHFNNMHHKLNITPRIDNKAYSKVHRVFPSAIPISIFTIIQIHWIYTRTVGKSLPFVRVGTYPTRNFATLDRHSYSRLYQ
jgi:hypothetical protein